MILSPLEKTTKLTEVFGIPEKDFSGINGVVGYLSVKYDKTTIEHKDHQNTTEIVGVRFGWDPETEGYYHERCLHFSVDNGHYDSIRDLPTGISSFSDKDKKSEIISLLRTLLPDYVVRVIPKPV